MDAGGQINIEPIEFKKRFIELKKTCEKLTQAIDLLLNENITESDEIKKIAYDAKIENDKAKRFLQNL